MHALGMMPPQVQVTAQQRISMLQAEYAALKEQKSMQGKELVKVRAALSRYAELRKEGNLNLAVSPD
eukprot:scaffold1947_cov207-Prasinococcus_capsulatus_cf.AAC.12